MSNCLESLGPFLMISHDTQSQESLCGHSVSGNCERTLLLGDMKKFHSSTDFGLYKVKDKSNRVLCWLKCASASAALASAFIILLHFTINPNGASKPINDTKVSEKIVSARPEPFDIKPAGPQPHQFVPTFPTTPQTTLRVPAPRYPQLTNYRHQYYPRHIGEAIRFMTKSPSRRKKGLEDHLQRYKPNDPSEVNLLAVGDFRFSPPAWKDFNQAKLNVLGEQQAGLVPPSVLRTSKFRHQTIPLTGYLNDQEGVGNKAAPMNVSVTGTEDWRYNHQKNEKGGFGEMFRKPFVVELSVYPAVPDFSSLPEKPVRAIAPGAVNQMHVALKVFPSVTVHHN